ncbi:hypothetical protein Prubr_65530 [Polymorphospora rubra]|uniref:Aldehyde dehydrogenase domain-containing protein n=1 Tax=Polymorphospora rubra TaxID=338584 RepID=A0A810N7H1_9ACTN|nr:hypothetical protein Prubr_65530 [Polymorphospora rubra]
MSTQTVNSTAPRDGAPGATGDEVITLDQSTGRELARYRAAGPEQVGTAVQGARTAAGPWWDLGFDGRAVRLRAWRREIARGGEDLAALIRAENGKSLEDGRAEVLSVLGHLTFVLDNVERVLGRRAVPAPAASPNQRAWVEYLPYGVVGVIGPWNFPLGTPGAIVIHALAAGNAVILKPSPVTLESACGWPGPGGRPYLTCPTPSRPSSASPPPARTSPPAWTRSRSPAASARAGRWPRTAPRA